LKDYSETRNHKIWMMGENNLLRVNGYGQYCKILLTFAFVLILFASSAHMQANAEVSSEKGYSHVLSQWLKDGLEKVDGVNITITPSQFSSKDGAQLLSIDNSFGYGEPILAIKEDESFICNVYVEMNGLYKISFDYFVDAGFLTPPEGSLTVNGVFQYSEARRLIFPVLWKHQSDIFPKDRHGNDVMPTQIPHRKWQRLYMEDASHIQRKHLLINLHQGENILEFTLTNGEMFMGNVNISSPEKTISYFDYINKLNMKSSSQDFILTIEAENYSFKNRLAINPVVSRDLEVSPYDTNKLLLNTLGGSTWRRGGQTVYYEIKVPQNGLYKIGFRYLQDLKPNARVFRTITINGEIPFEELRHYPFEPTQTWVTEVLGNGQDEFLFYLTEGTHVLGISVDISINGETIEVLSGALNLINNLSIEIRKLVGNDPDQHRDWEITDYMPALEQDLKALAKQIDEQRSAVLQNNGNNPYSEAIILIQNAVRQLLHLAEEPNRIPFRLNQLSGEIGSAAQTISIAIMDLESQPLVLDQLYVFSPDEQPQARSISFVTRIIERLKRLIHSLLPQQTAYAEEKKSIEIWVNRPRFFVDILRSMTEESFISERGINVEFSLMPNEQRLILANASGTAPDIALGVSNAQPYELGIRGAAKDLRQFDGFAKLLSQYSPGAILPMIVDDKVFGFPETQDFFVLFYREDILDALGLPVPDTWDDVKEILPELQRHGMNFYSSMASFGGYKPFMATAPYIFQHGGEMFSEDGMRTAIYEEPALRGIRLMTELFTIYGMPKQVPSFFQQFRDGTLPIGIGTFFTYVQLLNAAPEIRGSWNIAPSPGVLRDGEVIRWQPGTGQAAMIFNSTEEPDASWDFLEWWLSEDIQATFAHRLKTLHGEEFMWNTANLNAFKQLSWDEEDKEQVLLQWQWLREVPRIPGSYMLEREISDIWNRVVFDNANIRATVDDAVIRINREISRKMEEFGYMERGRMIVPYSIPHIEEVKSWIEGGR